MYVIRKLWACLEDVYAKIKGGGGVNIESLGTFKVPRREILPPICKKSHVCDAEGTVFDFFKRYV